MKFDELKKVLVKEHKDYKSMPFWSWNNEIDPDKLVQQIEDMHDAGIGGFIMHARTGLKTEYLGEKWFSCVEACLKKARKLKMEAWVYDENGWPSGFVGGKLLENVDYRAQFFDYKVLDKYDKNAFVVYKKVNDDYVIINSDESGVKEYLTIYLCTSPANTDILNPEVVDAFINETHEQYYKRFKDSFGRELAGFFTDEPQYYRANTPYTKMLLKDIPLKTIKENIIYLFTQDKQGYEFRSKYYSLLSKLYVENFYKKIYDWCDKHNCKLTGHSIEECGLAHQMSCSAGVMPSYEYEHMPAIDWLGKYIPNELITKQISSVASQLDKKYVLTETFACCGYDTTPRELRSVAEYQYFGGINRTCQHLYPYSMSAQGKYDHPPFFAKHSNWYEEFKTFNTYFERLGYIIGETKEVYDVAVIHPIKSIYLDYLRKTHHESVKTLEDEFVKLLDQLASYGITYHFIDESILNNHGEVLDKKLKVGSCEYDTIIVPNMPSISKSTLDILKKYKGKLLNLANLEYIDGKPSKISLPSNTTFENIINNTKLRIRATSGRYSIYARQGKLGEFVFIKNFSNTEKCSFEIENFGDYRALNLDDLTISPVGKKVILEGLGSLILIKSNEYCKAQKVVSDKDYSDKFVLKDISENYLVIDQVCYSKDGKNYTNKMPIQQAMEILLREDYKGNLFVKYDFMVKDLTNMKLVLEKARYDTFMVNGKSIDFKKSDFDFLFLEGDISNVVLKGKNEVVYSTYFYEHDGVHFALFNPLSTESLVNCLYYDTSLENIYIKGDFSLDKDYAICKKTLPTNFAIQKKGFPFFKGKIKYVGKYKYSGNGKVLLTLDGGFLVAKISANKKSVDLIMDNQVDITSILVEGENTIEITLKTTLRNLFGPHHFNHFGISPYSFTFRGQWKDGKPDIYEDDYVLVDTGLKSVKIREVE